MRLTRLLLIAFLVLFAGRHAAGQDNKQDYTPSQSAASQSDSRRTFTVTRGPHGAQWVSRRNDESRVADSTTSDAPDNDVCLVLHTLIVARVSKGSDATHLVAQRNCTPAQQFQMKSAVVTSSGQK